jgi:3D (Asp-Asp-Asp) domain-containing protein
MAVLGSSVDPKLFLQDYSGFTRAAEIQAQGLQNLGQNIAGGIEKVGDYFKEQGNKKKLIKQSDVQIDAALKLFPDLAPTLQGVRDQIRDENVPLDDRAAIAESVAGLINMGTNQMRLQAEQGLRDREMAMREGEFGLSKTQKELELEQFKQSQAEQEQITEFTARPMLDNVRRQTVEAERRGERPLISSEQLKLAYLKTPREQAQIAATALQGLPKARPVELRDIEFTRDGVATKGTAVFDEKTGTFRLVPVQEPIVQSIDGLLSVPFTNYSKGKDAGGPDEMQDKWTNKGFSATGPNLTKGVVAVNPDVFPLGTVFRDPATNEVFIAADKHGNKDKNVVDFYQDPSEYTQSKGKRNLEVVANVEPAKTPEGIRAQLDEISAALSQREGAGAARPAGIQPGAPKSTSTKTPTEEAIDEAKLAKLQAEAGAAERAVQAETGLAKAKAAKLALLEKKYVTDKGKPSELLENATGLGEVFSSKLRLNAPETIVNQKELGLELLEEDLMKAAKELKPVSEDEMKELMSRRPQISDPPEVWVWFIKRAREILESGEPRQAGQAATQAATPSAAPSIQDRTNKLRSLVPPK